jgi:hypothetical protein
MPPASDLQGEVRDILALARRDRAAAKAALGALSVEEQVAVVCGAPAARRGELFDLVPAPESVVPALPEAELVFAVKAIGRADAAWLLAHATDEQLRACVDLDAWRDFAPDRAALGEWIATFAEADDDTLLRGVQALDAEVVMLWMQGCVEVQMKPNDDQGWSPPAGGQTVDGVFYVIAIGDGDDADLVMRLLGLLFESDYWFYFRLLQSVIWELPTENEEWALKWRTGRMQDLGFPSWEEAAGIYARPRVARRSRRSRTSRRRSGSGTCRCSCPSSRRWPMRRSRSSAPRRSSTTTAAGVSSTRSSRSPTRSPSRIGCRSATPSRSRSPSRRRRRSRAEASTSWCGVTASRRRRSWAACRW